VSRQENEEEVTEEDEVKNGENPIRNTKKRKKCMVNVSLPFAFGMTHLTQHLSRAI